MGLRAGGRGVRFQHGFHLYAALAPAEVLNQSDETARLILRYESVKDLARRLSPLAQS